LFEFPKRTFWTSRPQITKWQNKKKKKLYSKASKPKKSACRKTKTKETEVTQKGK
jgi:hypothetical protein